MSSRHISPIAAPPRRRRTLAKLHPPLRLAVLLLLALFALPRPDLLTPAAHAQELPFADAFANRGTVTGPSGAGSGSNAGASLEPEEPRHGSVTGGRSVWLTWTAPADGLVTFSTVGSSFDTILAAYAYDNELKDEGIGPRDPTRPFADLREIARLDDSSNNLDSQIVFGVRQGVRYAIAVDGFRGASGSIALAWSLLESSEILPAVVTLEPDRSLRAGDTLTLSVELILSDDDDDDAEFDLKWYRDDEDLDDEEEATLVIPNFSAANVGTYRVQVRSGDVRFFSAPIEIQLNSEGQIVVLARDKPAHALDSALVGAPGAPALFNLSAPQPTSPSRARATLPSRPAAIGVSRGFNGSQIFSTAFAHRDPDEPLHCNIPGGASYWFAYAPPASGSLTLHTDNSSFDTVLAVYTFEPPFSGYADLIPVTCDNNSGANALTSRVEFNAEGNRTYLVVVDGVNGARGIVHLQYQLSVLPVSIPPSIVTPPASLTVTEGDTALFSVVASGSEPLAFQWLKDGTDLPGATSPVLGLPSAQTENAGVYEVRIQNLAGQIRSAPATLRLNHTIHLTLRRDGNLLRLAFTTARGWSYFLETVSDPTDTWTTLDSQSGTGRVLNFSTPLEAAPSRLFRIRAE